MTDVWPADVIVMTLTRVGADAGPDIALARDIAARAGLGRRVFAAGGVRNVDDLKRLADAGIAGALVATALHTGQIKTGDLEEIAGW
jgi:phosphoribosylformimino-5-aminoimidazole carboxamide ribotide isomerase